MRVKHASPRQSLPLSHPPQILCLFWPTRIQSFAELEDKSRVVLDFERFSRHCAKYGRHAQNSQPHSQHSRVLHCTFIDPSLSACRSGIGIGLLKSGAVPKRRSSSLATWLPKHGQRALRQSARRLLVEAIGCVPRSRLSVPYDTRWGGWFRDWGIACIQRSRDCGGNYSAHQSTVEALLCMKSGIVSMHLSTVVILLVYA